MFLNRGWIITDRLNEADMVQFTGGADVSPQMYGERKHPSAYLNPGRDMFEAAVFKAALMKKLPMAGICRGGQFLNVMCGGKMWQDVDMHAIQGTHEAWDNLLQTRVLVSSTHHQMMRPDMVNGEVLMTAKRSTRKERMGVSGVLIQRSDELDVEAVYYEKQECLCYQPHPEFPGKELDDCRDIYFNYISYYFGLEGGAL